MSDESEISVKITAVDGVTAPLAEAAAGVAKAAKEMASGLEVVATSNKEVATSIGRTGQAAREFASTASQAATQSRQSFGEIATAAHETEGAMGGLTDRFREFAAEQRQESRLSGFLARQISQMGISSKSAAGEITGFVSAFAFGGGIGVAIEAIKLGIEKFNEIGAEARKNAEEMKKWADESTAAIKKYEEALKIKAASEGKTGVNAKTAEDVQGLKNQREDAQKELDEAKKESERITAENQKKIRLAGGGDYPVEKINEVQEAWQRVADAETKVSQIDSAIIATTTAPVAAKARADERLEAANRKLDTEQANNNAVKKAHDERIKEETTFQARLLAIQTANVQGYSKIAVDGMAAVKAIENDSALTSIEKSQLIAATRKKEADDLAKYDKEAADKRVHDQFEAEQQIIKQAEELGNQRLNNEVERMKRLEEFKKQEDEKTKASIAKAEEPYLAAAKRISSQFASTFVDLVKGTETFAEASKKMALSILNDLARMALGAIAQEIVKMTGIGAADAAAATARRATAVAEVTSQAGVYGAKVAASSPALAIPVVGPALAVAEGVGAGATFEGIFGAIASASGGYDIPGGVNPLVQAHAREMILPAQYAEVIRNMAGGGGGGGKGGDININAMDGQSVARSLKKGRGAMVKQLHTAQKNGRRR